MQLSLDHYASGARLATDVANTAPEVHSGVEQLRELDELRDFLIAHDLGVLGTAQGLLRGEAALDDVRGLRAQLRTALSQRDPAILAQQATEMIRPGLDVLTLGDEPLTWQARVAVDAPAANVLGLIAGIGILGTLRTLGIERFRACASPTCRGTFIDISRAGRRRYCMPEICGNRVNVARHRARTRTTPAADRPT